MKFDKNRVFTPVNANELKIGSKVFVADSMYSLMLDVEHEVNMTVLEGVHDVSYQKRFVTRNQDDRILAYLIEE